MSDEIKKRKMLLRDFLSGVSVHDATIRVGEKYGTKGYGIRTCQRWYRKFRQGDLDLTEKPSHYNQPKEKKTDMLLARSEKNTDEKKTTRTTTDEKKTTRTTTDEKKTTRTTTDEKKTTRTTTDEKKTTRKPRQKRPKPKEFIKVDSVTFKNQANSVESQLSKNDTVQKLMQRKQELTVSKVTGGVMSTKSNMNSKQVITLPAGNTIIPTTKMAVKRPAAPVTIKEKIPRVAKDPPPKIKVRALHALEADLKLTPSMAQRLTSVTSTESHSIGDGKRTSHKLGEAVKKPITVQFQNVTPEIARNTVRKTIESAPTPLNPNKRLGVPQSTPLSSPRGVIYLNPQEIFRQNLGFPSKLQQVSPNGGIRKSVSKIPLTKVQPAAAPQPPVVICDSDSEDDFDFPKDIVLPPPKVRDITATFTTYWDMQTDRPILLNPTEDVIPPTSIIEID